MTNSIQGAIHIQSIYSYPLARRGDKFLMHEIQKHVSSKKQLADFNACRLFLQVLRLSDICNATGTEILEPAWNGIADLHSFSTWVWPRQDNPPGHCWSTWRRLLRKVFLTSQSGRLTSRKLHTPMGAWLPRDHYDRQWHYYYDSEHRITALTSASLKPNPVVFSQLFFRHSESATKLCFAISDKT